MATVETSDKTPEWMLLLEKKTNRPHRLAHEIGAGAPCLACGDKCPGLDLHFWRKLCRNCKCKKEDHDVVDDDGRAQFEILLGAGSKRKKPGAVLKFKVPDIKADALVENKKNVPFDWVPPNVSEDIAAEYMQQLPAAKIPISGSDGALYRRQQLERQMPLHDLDATRCHNLTPQEIEELQKYLDNLKNNVVGQGRVDKVPTLYSEQRLSYRGPTLQHNVSRAVLHTSQSDQSLHSQPHLNQHFNAVPQPFRPFNSADDSNLPPPLPDSLPPDHIQSSLRKPGSFVPSSSKTSGTPINLAHSTAISGQFYPGSAPSSVHHGANKSAQNATVLFSQNPNVDLHSANFSDQQDPRYSKPHNIHDHSASAVSQDGTFMPFRQESSIAHSTAIQERGVPGSSQALSQRGDSILQGKSFQNPDHPKYDRGSTNSTPGVYNMATYGTPLEYGKTEGIPHQLTSEIQPHYIQNKTSFPMDGSNFNENNNTTSTVDQSISNLSQSIHGQPGNINNISHQAANDNKSHDNLNAAGFQTVIEPWSNPTQIAAAARFEHSVVPYDLAGSSNVTSDSMPRSAQIIQQTGLMSNDLAAQMELLSAEEHPVMSHLSCKQCAEPLVAGEVAVFADRAGDNTAWHPKCFVCNTCDELLVDLVYFFSKGNVYCGRHFAELLNITRCFACDELIFVKEYTVAEGKTFHVKHFCCYECDIPLAGKQYVPADDQPTCLDCYQDIFGKKCHTCSKQIAAGNQQVIWKELNWHADATCFRCNGCSRSLLGGKFVMRDEQPYCNKDCVLAAGKQ